MTAHDQPRVRHNEWRALTPWQIGRWEPTLTVTVVIPAHNSHETLPLTLASLARQTYPAELMDVVVVDNGSQPALELPEIRPARTRLIRAEEDWGSAYSVAVGSEAASGDVILRLDADMVVYRDHVEAHMRWHHLVDYAVVLGHKMFVDPNERPEAVPSPAEVAAATERGTSSDLFPGMSQTAHEWIERVYERTDHLSTAGQTAWTVFVGATGSMPTALYRATGGMDTALKLGSDTEIGYRLGELGAVFIPDDEARSWHVGLTNMTRRRDETIRYMSAFRNDRVADSRYRRHSPGRQFTVPRLRVSVDVAAATFEQARATLDGVLANVDVDLVCTCTGPWDSLEGAYRSPLDEPMRELRMIAAEFRGDARVHLSTAPAAPYPSPYTLDVPAGWVPTAGSIAALLAFMETKALGRMSILMPDGSRAVLERAAAAARVDRLLREGEDRDDLMDRLYGTWWSEGLDVGFRPWDAPVVADPVPEKAIARLRAELLDARARIASLEAAASPAATAEPAGTGTPPSRPTRSGWRSAVRRALPAQS
jgi:GT2 family glycosyltransferase